MPTAKLKPPIPTVPSLGKQKKSSKERIIKMFSKDQLKEKISIIILLKYFKLLSYDHNPKYRFPCPIHQGENNNCCYCSDKNIFRCYSECNKSYDIFNIYTELTGETNFNTIIKNLNQLFENETFKQFIQKHNQIKELGAKEALLTAN